VLVGLLFGLFRQKSRQAVTKGPRFPRDKITGAVRSVPEEGSRQEPARVPLEEHMKLLTKICMPALLLGAAFMVPAMAQNDENTPANGNAAAAAPAQPAQDANSAATPADQNAENAAAAPSQSAENSKPTSSAPSSADNTQMAMNTTGNAAAVSSIPDTKSKYSRAKRAADNKSESQTTKQLNQASSASNGNAQ
jgi:hypothetical protein